MQQLLSLFIVGCVCGLRIQNHVVTKMPTVALPDVFGPVTTEMYERARNRRRQAAKKSHLLPGHGSRASSSCDMCVNLVLHQDTTLDWTPEFRAEIGGQFKHILQDLSDNHPGSTFSVVTFQDKPVPELGESTDYCVSYDARMLSDPAAMLDIYATTPEGVGYDWPENHYGSLYEMVNSPSYLPWSEHSECSNLVITITDASPHFEGDEFQSAYPNLTPYTADYDESNAESFCTQKYYPTPFMVSEALLDMNVYHGTIVWRAGDINTLALRSWAWFDTLVGQEDAFTQALFEDDNDWMTPLENILRAFMGDECFDTATTTTIPTTDLTSSPVASEHEKSQLTTDAPVSERPTTTEEPITTGVTGGPQGTEDTLSAPHETATTTATTTVGATTTSAESGTSIEVSAQEESTSTALCNCPSEDPCCMVQPELYLMIKKKPSEFDMHMKA